ncbi:MAG: hypothetical protein AAFP89_01705 [Bacteroidota bacterium]
MNSELVGLVKAFEKDGNQFNEIVRLTYPNLLLVSQGIIKGSSPVTAEDIPQNVYTKVLAMQAEQGVLPLELKQRPMGYLCTMAKNDALQYVNRAKKIEEIGKSIKPGQPNLSSLESESLTKVGWLNLMIHSIFLQYNGNARKFVRKKAFRELYKAVKGHSVDHVERQCKGKEDMKMMLLVDESPPEHSRNLTLTFKEWLAFINQLDR